MKIDFKDVNLIYYRHNKNLNVPKLISDKTYFYEVTIVFKGALIYFVDNKRIVVNSKDVIFVKKGSLRERDESPQGADYVSFNITSEQELDFPVISRNVVSNEINLMVAACDEMVHNSFDYENRVVTLLFAILMQVSANAKRATANPLVERIGKYLEKNVDKKITLSEIGEKMFFSAVYCDTLFKKETGQSIIDYLLDLRINEAKKLLIEGEQSFRMIADNTGFNDYNYFSRVFKKRTGYTPSQYRKLFKSLYY